jgi:indolepyruvate ferredoxin oxidoreductase, beta subunit
MKDNETVTNVFLCGVGGQGTILAGNILNEVFFRSGFDVKKAEVHGMAQRGGDVSTHFRFGKKVYSPLIEYGHVDYLISFEMLEAARYINWLKPTARTIINKREILPPSVSIGQVQYPGDVEKIFNEHFKGNVWFIDGQDLATRLGNSQAANVILLGAFSNFFPDVAEETWIETIKSLMAPKLHDFNCRAFVEGKKSLSMVKR